MRLLASFQVLVQKEMMDITPLSESPYPFLHLKPEKIRRTPLGQIVGETPGFLPTFSTDEPNVITRWGWGVFKQLRADVSKYRPEVYKSGKSKILKKIHKVALGKLLT